MHGLPNILRFNYDGTVARTLKYWLGDVSLRFLGVLPIQVTVRWQLIINSLEIRWGGQSYHWLLPSRAIFTDDSVNYKSRAEKRRTGKWRSWQEGTWREWYWTEWRASDAKWEAHEVEGRDYRKIFNQFEHRPFRLFPSFFLFKYSWNDRGTKKAQITLINVLCNYDTW